MCFPGLIFNVVSMLFNVVFIGLFLLHLIFFLNLIFVKTFKLQALVI